MIFNHKKISSFTLNRPTPAAQSHLTTENRLQMLSPSEDSLYQSSPQKKIRRGYMKREAGNTAMNESNDLMKIIQHLD
jgi:hypothetical protein